MFSGHLFGLHRVWVCAAYYLLFNHTFHPQNIDHHNIVVLERRGRRAVRIYIYSILYKLMLRLFYPSCKLKIVACIFYAGETSKCAHLAEASACVVRCNTHTARSVPLKSFVYFEFGYGLRCNIRTEHSRIRRRIMKQKWRRVKCVHSAQIPVGGVEREIFPGGV